MHEINVFVTLTYDDEHLPADGSLVKRDLQLFLKRLRKEHEPAKLRYYACGEYGETTLRPHYHAILFGIDFADKRKHSVGKRGDDLFISETLDKIWGLGHCYIGRVTYKSAGYVARYCLKKVNGQKASDHYQGREPEFALMSLKPGIGATWFDKNNADVFPSDFMVLEGKKVPPSRFYTDRFKDMDEAKHASIKAKRIERMRKYRKDLTPARLKVREEVTAARVKTYQQRKIN